MFCHIPHGVQLPVLLYSHQWLVILAHQVPISYSRQLRLFGTAAEKPLMTTHTIQIKVLKTKRNSQKRKTIVYLLKKSLKHYSLLPFIISPFARRYCDSCLCFQSFNNGTILYYSDLLTGLRRIMSKEKKREAVLTC